MTTKLPTLDAFIRQSLASDWRISVRAHVLCDGFARMYVRMYPRFVNGRIHEPTLTLASIEARDPGKGAFSRLVSRLRREYPGMHLYVELVHNARFCARLESMGFTRVDPINPSYFLPAR